MADIDISVLVGQTLSEITVTDDQITFRTTDGRRYMLYHEQDCWEHVTIESIVGDMSDLIGAPITLAEEASSNENPPDANAELIEYEDSFTWTFYKLATVNGYVDIRFYGESNGYYSEDVSFVELIN